MGDEPIAPSGVWTHTQTQDVYPVECVCVFKRKKDNFEHNVTIVLSYVLCKIKLFGHALCFLLLYSGNTIIFHIYNDTTMFFGPLPWQYLVLWM